MVRPTSKVSSPPDRFTRPRRPMPALVRDALEARGLMDADRARPPYQRNDHLGWIDRAQRDATQARRLQRMLDELALGGRCMKMPWRPVGRPVTPRARRPR